VEAEDESSVVPNDTPEKSRNSLAHIHFNSENYLFGSATAEIPKCFRISLANVSA
jgi:hypothetical protein